MTSYSLIYFSTTAICNLTLERSDSDLVDPLPDIDNQYIKFMPDQKFDIQILSDDDPNDDADPDQHDPYFSFKPTYHPTRKIAYELGLEDNEWVYEDDFLNTGEDFDEDYEDIEWEYWDNATNSGIPLIHCY